MDNNQNMGGMQPPPQMQKNIQQHQQVSQPQIQQARVQQPQVQQSPMQHQQDVQRMKQANEQRKAATDAVQRGFLRKDVYTYTCICACLHVLSVRKYRRYSCDRFCHCHSNICAVLP